MSGELAPRLQALTELACPNGGWGYVPGQGAHLEPTILALLALAPEADRFAATIEPARAWVERQNSADGTYRLDRGRPEAVWGTGLVGFWQAAGNAPPERLRRTLAVLTGITGEKTERTDADINDIDNSLAGWPWGEGNFAWVEPTCWALLALRRGGQAAHPRVREGQNLLLDRTLAGGGVNYGNRRIFGVTLEPIPGPTSLAVLALQGRDDPRVVASVEYLCRQARTAGDLEHLAWVRLALDAHRHHPGAADAVVHLRERLLGAWRERADTPYLRESPLRVALALLALGVEERNPFRLAPEPSADAPVTLTRPVTPKVSLADWALGRVQGLALAALTQLKPAGALAGVHIAPVADYNDDLAGVLRRQYEHFRAAVPLAGKRVVLKPNLVEYHRDKVINTHPHVVAAAIELCRAEGAAEVIVAEGPGHWRNVEYLVAASGLGDVLRHHNVPFVDLNHDEPVKTPNLGRLTGLQNLFLARTIASADVVISLPKLKTHHWAGATLSLKNLFGTLPGICYGWPKNELHWRGIDNSIVDIALTRTPDLAIVDGVVGMEGDGPLNGSPKPLGVLLMGNDLLAVDATCCRLMRLDPEKLAYLVLGARKKLGALAEGQIQQLGETIAARARPFATVPQFQPVWLGPRE